MIEEIALDPAGKTRFKYQAKRVEWCKMALSGVRYEVMIPTGFTPRRILDLGCQEGAFACWAARRFPRAWIDMVEPDAVLRALAAENAPPGAKVMKATKPEELETGVDLVRIGNGTLYLALTAGVTPGAREPLRIFDFVTGGS